MTNELEKQFFQCFGIEPKCQNKFINPSKCPFNESRECCDCVSFEYPQISDRILLELICIINQSDAYLHGEEYYFEAVNYKDLKEEVIAKCKRLADKNAFSEVTGEHIKHQVRTLFEEG